MYVFLIPRPRGAEPGTIVFGYVRLFVDIYEGVLVRTIQSTVFMDFYEILDIGRI